MSLLAGKQIPVDGLGLMRYSFPGKVVPDDKAFPVLKSAISLGARLWNGSTHYGTPDENSIHLVKRYFTANPSDASNAIFCLKGGVVSMGAMDCSPENMRRTVEETNRILDGKKTLDFFGPGRVDPKVPIEDTVRELGELVKEGKISGILMSEASAETIRRASKIHQISVIEAEVSLWARDVFTNGVAEACKELGIVIIAYSPLGRGMLAGNFNTLEDVANGEFQGMMPRFQGENFEQNLKLINALQKIASKKGCSSAQLALGWLKSKSGKGNNPVIIPIAGTRSKERIKENCTEIKLTDEELREIDDALDSFPVAGGRYPENAAQLLEY